MALTEADLNLIVRFLKADVELSRESVSDGVESTSGVKKKTSNITESSKLKLFNLYTATVVGPCTDKDSALCVELFFPNGQKGLFLRFVLCILFSVGTVNKWAEFCDLPLEKSAKGRKNTVFWAKM